MVADGREPQSCRLAARSRMMPFRGAWKSLKASRITPRMAATVPGVDSARNYPASGASCNRNLDDQLGKGLLHELAFSDLNAEPMEAAAGRAPSTRSSHSRAASSKAWQERMPTPNSGSLRLAHDALLSKSSAHSAHSASATDQESILSHAAGIAYCRIPVLWRPRAEGTTGKASIRTTGSSTGSRSFALTWEPQA